MIEYIFPPNCKFENEIVSWLKTTLDLRNDKRGIVLLTHHQYYSAFEKDYTKPAEQIAEIIGNERKVLWFWGHEHRLAIYGKYKSKNGITAYGRCIGHGAMPVEFKEKVKTEKVANCNLILYDERVNTEIENIKIGYNGFVILNVDGMELKADYFDINNELLLREIWTYDFQTGEIKGKEIKLFADDLSVYADDINRAIN